MRYVSYAKICVYLDISKELLENIKLTWQDEKWVKIIDYEHILFHCRKCHEHEHMFRACPLNNPIQTAVPKQGEKDMEGFEKVTSRRRATKTYPNRENKKDP